MEKEEDDGQQVAEQQNSRKFTAAKRGEDLVLCEKTVAEEEDATGHCEMIGRRGSVAAIFVVVAVISWDRWRLTLMSCRWS